MAGLRGIRCLPWQRQSPKPSDVAWGVTYIFNYLHYTGLKQAMSSVICPSTSAAIQQTGEVIQCDTSAVVSGGALHMQ